MAVPILSSIFGEKPEIAPYTPTEFGPEQIKALKENISAFPWISQLGNLYQSYMTDAFNKAIPGFSDILATGGRLTQKMQATAGEELEGKIPKDVQETVQRSSAFQNLMAGGGGGMASANTARNFGLTSLDMISRGTEMQGQAGNAAQRWAGLASGLIMSPAGYLVTPQQQVELTMANRLHQQATEQLRKNVAAAPDPIAKGLSDIVENLTAAYLGGKVGNIGAGNEAATKATMGPGPSDVTTPGYTMQGGGGGFGGGGPGGGGGGFTGGGTDLWNAYQPPAGGDLWSSYQPGSPFGFGSGTGNESIALNAMGGTTDFWNTTGVPQNYNPFGFGGTGG